MNIYRPSDNYNVNNYQVPSMPNGTPRKLLDVSKSKKIGWTYTTKLETGIMQKHVMISKKINAFNSRNLIY